KFERANLKKASFLYTNVAHADFRAVDFTVSDKFKTESEKLKEEQQLRNSFVEQLRNSCVYLKEDETTGKKEALRDAQPKLPGYMGKVGEIPICPPDLVYAFWRWFARFKTSLANALWSAL